MFKVIILISVFIVVVFLFNRYYQASSMKRLPESITFKVKNNEYTLPCQTRKEDRFLASPLMIQRSELVCGGEKVYFESVSVESLYALTQTTEKTARILFDAQKSRTIFSINGLDAIELTDETGKVINLFALQHERKSLELLYGLSNQSFAQIVMKLSATECKSSGEVLTLNEPQADWSVKHIHIDGIVSSIDY